MVHTLTVVAVAVDVFVVVESEGFFAGDLAQCGISAVLKLSERRVVA